MKSLLKFLGVLVVLFVWIELVDLSFNLMNKSDDMLFYVGFFILAIITCGPIFYFGENIVMFLKNMKGVFTDEENRSQNKFEKYQNCILCAARIEGRKATLNLVKAIKDTNYKLVLVGKESQNQKKYVDHYAIRLNGTTDIRHFEKKFTLDQNTIAEINKTINRYNNKKPQTKFNTIKQ